ncbi:MAG: MYXO-CTERM domain-containing protein [Myxococcota bacterium]|jgi:MYXO-CTERM domain-containing protein
MISTIALLLTVQNADAVDYIESWSYDFPDGEELDGQDGWASGYDEDPWYGYVSDSSGYSYACPLTDENGGSFGSGDAADNWFVYEDADWNDSVFTSNFYVTDEDAFGLIFRFQDRENYYLFLLTNDATPVETDGGMALIKVTDGRAEVLDSARSGFDEGALGAIAIEVNDNEITAWYSSEYTGPDVFDSAEVVLSADDPDPFGPGLAGYYAYDVGYPGYGQLDAYIGEPTIYLTDDDEDGVTDDLDNCEFEPNADQADTDGDDIGDVCDETPGTEDTGGGDTNDTNDTNTDDTDIDLSQIEEGDVKLGGGCATVAGGGGWALLLVGLLASGRRRRS